MFVYSESETAVIDVFTNNVKVYVQTQDYGAFGNILSLLDKKFLEIENGNTYIDVDNLSRAILDNKKFILDSV